MKLALGTALLLGAALAPVHAQTRRLSGGLAGGDIADGLFALAPDGAHVVFSGHFQSLYANELYSARADGSDEPLALFPWRQPFGGGGGVPEVAFFRITPDSQRVVYAVDHNVYAGNELYVAPLDGSAPPLRLAQGGPSFAAFQISPDGTRVVYALRALTSSNLEGLYSLRLDDRVRPIADQQPTRLTDPQPDVGEILDFQISSDSSHVVFTYTALDLGCSDCDAVDPIELFSVPIRGGESPLRLSQPARWRHLGQPPDGRPFAGGLGEYVAWFAISLDAERVAFVTREQFGPCSSGCSFVTRLFSVPMDEGSRAERPLLLFRGALADPRLSHDLDRVVFLGDLDGDGQALELLSQPLYGGEPPVRLHPPLPPGAAVIRFEIAPDDHHVVFTADLSARGALELFSAPIDASAAPVALCSPLAPGRAVTDFAISADSTHVVYRADQEVDERFELYRAPLAGPASHARRVGAPPPDHVLKLSDNGSVADFELHGASVLFHADESTPGGARQHLYRVPLDARSRPVRLSGAEGGGAFFVDAAGTRTAYQGSIDHETDVHVYAAPLDGSAPSVRIDDPAPGVSLGDAIAFELHPDGQRVFFSASARQYEFEELFITRVDRAAPVERLELAIPDGCRLIDFRLAPAVERVAYRLACPQPDGGYVTALFGAPLDGSAPGVRLAEHVSQGTPDYLVAGNRVVYRVAGNGQPFELFSVLLDGSASPVRLNPLPTSNGGEFRLSPDGARVVYFTNPVQSSRFELFSAPSDGSAPAVRLNGALVSGGDVQAYLISPDSARVVYTADQERDNTVELYSVPLAGSAAPLKLHASQPAAREVTALALTADSRRVIYVADHTLANRHELYAVPIDGSASPLQLDPAQPSSADAGNLYLSPDGRRVVYESSGTLGAQADIRSAPTDGSAPSVRLNPPLVAGGNVRLSVSAPAFANGWVAYWADQETDERYELFSAPLDGSAPSRRLSPPLSGGGGVHWVLRADGGRVVFQANVNGEYEHFDLFSVPIDGRAPAARLNPPIPAGGALPRFYHTGFQLHPDGRSVVYLAALDAVDVYELYQSLLEPLRPSAPPRVR